MIPALDPDGELDFQIFGTSVSRFGSSKRQNPNRFRGVMILVLNPDQE